MKTLRHQQHTVTLRLNGAERSGNCEPRTLLSDFLRQELGATGVHVGCEHGVCGACTVRVDGRAWPGVSTSSTSYAPPECVFP